MKVVVFDIDNTLCENDFETFFKVPNKTFGEFKEIYILHDKFTYRFIPHLDILFKFLIEKGVRIIFFSAGVEERNIGLIDKLLNILFDKDDIQEMKNKGNFEIYSRNHLQYGKKNLDLVLKDGESIDQVVIIEDDLSFVYKENQYIRILLNSNKSLYYPHHFNNSLYLLGIFIDYFGFVVKDKTFKALPVIFKDDSNKSIYIKHNHSSIKLIYELIYDGIYFAYLYHGKDINLIMHKHNQIKYIEF